MQHRSAEGLEKYVKKLIEQADGIVHGVPIDASSEATLTHDPYLERNLFFYCWLLQRAKYVIERSELLNYIDTDTSDEKRFRASFILDSNTFKDYLDDNENNENRFRLSSEAINAITAAFDDDKFSYRLTKDLRGFSNKLTGQRLAET